MFDEEAKTTRSLQHSLVKMKETFLVAKKYPKAKQKLGSHKRQFQGSVFFKVMQ
jgi:hypothetical protein